MVACRNAMMLCCPKTRELKGFLARFLASRSERQNMTYDIFKSCATGLISLKPTVHPELHRNNSPKTKQIRQHYDQTAPQDQELKNFLLETALKTVYGLPY